MLHYFTELARTFRVADFFDIAIISLLIYVVLIWLKATASRFVVLGISILGLVYIIALFFHLYLTAVVLQAFFAILFIALVVIFQEDLRRFFERISIWGAIRKHDNLLSGYPEIEILSRAIDNLARKKIGALIVIRGIDPLDRHLECGLDLDGRLSEPLLESIFDPHSLGHDGAAIIERGRVTKFGCHLPLSTNTRELGNRGTRHGAALGLAERSDALCIAVSEERGTITLAHGETLKELKDPSKLQAALERFYVEKFPLPNQRTWRHWIIENPREKAIAIFLSCALWFIFVFQTGTIRRDFLVPIEYRNLASSWAIEEPYPKEATITLLGRARAFDLLDAGALKVAVDMSHIKEGGQDITLSTRSVYRPSSLSVVAIEPEEIRIKAYQMVAVDLPVEVQRYGALPANLKLVRIEASPDVIPVIVPKRTPTASLRVLTTPIDLRKITETTTITPDLIFPDEAKFSGQKQPEVEVRIEVSKGEKAKK